MTCILIADDEPLARERLLRLLEQLPGYQVLEQTAANGQEAIDLCARLKPDILLLDICMPGLTGLQVSAQINNQKTPPAVIFCTGHGEFALEAFQVSAVDYLLKPIRLEHLQEALAKARRLNRTQLTALQQVGQNMPDNIPVQTHRGLELIPVNSIISFIADNKYITLYHEGGEALIDDSLKNLESEFPGRFVRIHRNTLVASDRIQRLQKNPDGTFLVYLRGRGDHPMTASRRYFQQLRELLAH